METIIASAPCWYAKMAVSALKIPFKMSGNEVIDFNQSTSFQVIDWSNKLDTYSLMPELPLLLTADATPANVLLELQYYFY